MLQYSYIVSTLFTNKYSVFVVRECTVKTKACYKCYSCQNILYTRQVGIYFFFKLKSNEAKFSISNFGRYLSKIDLLRLKIQVFDKIQVFHISHIITHAWRTVMLQPTRCDATNSASTLRKILYIFRETQFGLFWRSFLTPMLHLGKRTNIKYDWVLSTYTYAEWWGVFGSFGFRW